MTNVVIQLASWRLRKKKTTKPHPKAYMNSGRANPHTLDSDNGRTYHNPRPRSLDMLHGTTPRTRRTEPRSPRPATPLASPPGRRGISRGLLRVSLPPFERKVDVTSKRS